MSPRRQLLAALATAAVVLPLAVVLHVAVIRWVTSCG
jgi:hypothetical protein